MNREDVEALKSKHICHHCIGEEYLRAEIQGKGERRRCSYCKERAKSYTIGEMAERIEDVFEQHYRRTSDQPTWWQQSLLSDRESDYVWSRDGEPVEYAIVNAADMPEEAAHDIQAILDYEHGDVESQRMGEETEFCSGSYYEGVGTSDQAWQEEWSEFERSLKMEARFFSRVAADHLREVFSGIEKMSADDGRPLIVDVGPGTKLTTFHRARVFQSDEKLIPALCRPDLHLGSPPPSLASHGRMNARGISVFYGSSHPKAAIAEVRPPVGSQVAVAPFEILRPLRLLDLTALGAVSERGSIFDPELAGRMSRAMFLRSLSQRITRPVMPDDEAFDYLATQAIADFLATENDPQLDGILFPSAQAAGDAVNVVLFHKAARVLGMEISPGTEIEAKTGEMHEEGWDRSYTVIEEVAPEVPKVQEEKTDGWPELTPLTEIPWTPPDPDSREPTLRINEMAIEVHVVERVIVETEQFDVTRHRWQKSENTDF